MDTRQGAFDRLLQTLSDKQLVGRGCNSRLLVKIPLTPFRKGGMVESPPFLKGDLGGFYCGCATKSLELPPILCMDLKGRQKLDGFRP